MHSIADLHVAVAEWAMAFDPDACSVDQCRSVLAEVVGVERIVAAVKAQVAARVASTGSWRSAGDRSPAHQLARETGTTVGAAREVLETGTALKELPDLAAAAKRGELAPGQTAAVAAVGTVAPELVPELVARARETTLPQLREDCARALAARVSDQEEQRERIREQRSLRHWREASGVGVMQLRDAPDVIARVMTHLGPARESLFREARERGDCVRPDALDADALVATVVAGSTGRGTDVDDVESARKHRCAPRAKVIVRVDFDALLRSYPIDGEVCEIAGYGPVAVSAVREMVASGDPFLSAVVTKGVQVVGVAHLGRRALSHQQTALEWLNPTCAADGCMQAVRLELEHRVPWARAKVTLVDLMDRLCEHCHDLKTYQGWSLVHGVGKRAFVPPHDARHPGHVPSARGDPLSA